MNIERGERLGFFGVIHTGSIFTALLILPEFFDGLWFSHNFIGKVVNIKDIFALKKLKTHCN